MEQAFTGSAVCSPGSLLLVEHSEIRKWWAPAERTRVIQNTANSHDKKTPVKIFETLNPVFGLLGAPK